MMAASISRRVKVRGAVEALYPTAKLRDLYRQQACAYRGSTTCRYCQAKDRNGGVCPSATFLGLEGRR